MNATQYLINFDNINDAVLDTPIYRIFSLEKFLTSLNENLLFFVKTKSWEDPFEAFLLKQLIWAEDGSENYPWEEAVGENFYGQCWTFLKESNFLWKIYAPNCDGVLVRSSIRKIVNLFLEGQDDRGKFYFGKVKYWPEEKIKEHFENKSIVEGMLNENRLTTVLHSLFIKRQEFKQEEEVRLIYVKAYGGIKDISVIQNGYAHERLHLFNELVDELIIDPRLDDLRANIIKRLIIKLGFIKPLRKSTMFDSPYLKLRVSKLGTS